jgi:hypothetical protein
LRGTGADGVCSFPLRGFSVLRISVPERGR